jgi:hypothetical protein
MVYNDRTLSVSASPGEGGRSTYVSLMNSARAPVILLLTIASHRGTLNCGRVINASSIQLCAHEASTSDGRAE